MLKRLRARGARVLALLAALALIAACSREAGRDGGSAQPEPNAHLLIAEVYPNGYARDGSDQFIRLYNPSDQAVDLAGWSLGDAKLRAAFPPGARIGPRQSLYAARDAAGFRQLMGAPPDFVWGAGPREAGVPALSGGAGFAPGRDRGTVVLRDGSGQPADALVYGDGTGAVPGWRGAPAPAPMPGEIIDRSRDEATWNEMGPGEYARDTDTAADFKQGSSWVDQRVYRPGQTWFGDPTYTVDNITLYASPDSSYPTVTALLDRARRSIDINLYDFGLVPVAEKLADAVRRGVKVRLILEAQSATKIYPQESYIAKVVAEAGGQVRWIVNDGSAGMHGRYVYDHAKYAVVDGRYVFVQSENMVNTGTPIDPSFGNRGWGAVVEHQGLAAYLSRVFEADWNPGFGDLKAYEPGTPFGPPAAGFTPNLDVPKGRYPHPFPAMTVKGPVAVTPVLAPDHALLETKGIIGLMRSAKQTLYVEQQYIHLFWGRTGGPESTPDLFLAEAIAAARRGVKVRLLVSDAFLDPSDPKDSSNTVRYVNELARREGLDMQARIFKSRLLGMEKIHNKGVIVDDRQVLISSINWSYNSPANNREVGLILEHPEIGAYFVDLFTYDWYDGTPADYPLVIEVAPDENYVEIANPGTAPVDLGGWNLATEDGAWALPARTQLKPGAPLILVRDGREFRSRHGAVPNLVEIPGLSLRGGKGSVRLRRGNITVDEVAWGEGEPGWKLTGPAGAAFCRPDPGRDTNTYLDWAAGQPSPGVPGCGKA